MLDEKSEETIDDEQLTLDDLDGVAGGAVIKYARYGRTRVVEYSCPKCGCKDLDGIEDGTRYADMAEASKARKGQVLRCRNCGFDTTSELMARRQWSE